MPARRMHQKSENRARFRQLIREKVALEKESMKDRIDDELPSWIAWAIKPAASFMFGRQAARDNAKGERGEDRAFLNLWLLLPGLWIILNDVVLEPKPDEFIQLDHILVGPPGIFLVETKAWDGAFLARRDNWTRKQANRWVRCSSPTRQSLRHRKLLIHWMKENLSCEAIPGDPEDWVHSNVVFTRAQWLKVDNCSVPVFQGATGFALHVRGQTRQTVLLPEHVDKIAQAIADAGPCERQPPATCEPAATTVVEAPASGAKPAACTVQEGTVNIRRKGENHPSANQTGTPERPGTSTLRRRECQFRGALNNDSTQTRHHGNAGPCA